MQSSGRNANPDQLKAAVNAGRTGDKVAALDPAAAPLGTDEEAAGTPINRRILGHVLDEELSKGLSLGDPAHAARRDAWSAVALWLSAVAFACAIVALTAMLVSS
jgi:hypothetical protein